MYWSSEKLIRGRTGILIRVRRAEGLGTHGSDQGRDTDGTSLAVQWLRLRTSNAGGRGFNPWSGY